MLARSLALALVLTLVAAHGARAEDDADASPEPATAPGTAAAAAIRVPAPAASAEASSTAPAAPAPPASPSVAASAPPIAPPSGAPATPASPASPAPVSQTKDLEGTYAYDIDYILEQQPDYLKFTPQQKKAAHDKAVEDSPRLEVVITAERVKILENKEARTDASYKLLKKVGTSYVLELLDSLAKDKKPENVNFELTGTRLKLTKDGDKDELIWVKIQ